MDFHFLVLNFHFLAPAFHFLAPGFRFLAPDLQILAPRPPVVVLGRGAARCVPLTDSGSVSVWKLFALTRSRADFSVLVSEGDDVDRIA